MAENGLKNQEVIGVAFDGTGLGGDNHLWGAEFFICNYKDFERKAHLREIPLLGQERAILEPLRLVMVWLYLLYRDKFFNLKLDLLKKMDKNKWQVLKNMYLSGFNSPLASSMGRLFDAVGSLVLGKDKVIQEAELAIQLERLAKSYKLQSASYKFKIIKDGNNYILDPLPMFKEIITDLKSRELKEKIAYRFDLTVAQMIKGVCLILRKENKINKVVLSGGVFQNNLLLGLTLDLLYKEIFHVFIHKDLSCNDSGISLGQVAIASFGS
jgi:hydrogenase maturation protein HypF